MAEDDALRDNFLSPVTLLVFWGGAEMSSPSPAIFYPLRHDTLPQTKAHDPKVG